MNNRKSARVSTSVKIPQPNNGRENGDEHTVEQVRLLDSMSRPIPVSYYQSPPQSCSPCGLARFMGSLMVLLVIGLISVTVIPYWAHFADGSTEGTLCLIIFHVLLGLMITAYFQVILTDPGTVPREWHEAVARSEVLRKQYPQCHRSGLHKPPRSHYDSITGRLVLNMDHFCPWTNNTIGFLNRKFFILFLFYTSLTCGWAAASLYYYIGSPDLNKDQMKHSSKTDGYFSTTTVHILTFMAVIFDATFSAFLFCFFALHLNFAATNQTSIETGRRALRFNLNFRHNFESVFGKDHRLWICPVYGNGPAGDGVHWLTRSGDWEGDENEIGMNELERLEESDLKPANGFDGIQVV